MPRDIKGIKIFIGSAGGLDSLREEFRRIIDEYNRLEALPLHVLFEPVGWEDTLPTGIKRALAAINDELRQCDYSLFLLRDRWGTPPDTAASGSPYSSGTEEEFAVAGECIAAKTMGDRAALFLPVSDAHLKDPGPQLSSVLKFRKRLEDEKNCLFQQLKRDEDFAERLRALLAKWRRAHEPRSRAGDEARGLVANINLGPDTDSDNNKNAAYELLQRQFRVAFDQQDYTGALALASLGSLLAQTQQEAWLALICKGIALSMLDRCEDAVAAYDEVIARFGAASELELRVPVARALVSKGFMLSQLDRGEHAIAAYDEVIARFGTASEFELLAPVATAMVNKGLALGELDRSEDAVAVYDEVIARYGTASQLELREAVAIAMASKGLMLSMLDRSEDAVTVYDEVIGRFGAASEPALRERVAMAMFSKGFRLGTLNRSEDAIDVYDELIERYGSANEPALRAQVAMAMFSKGFRLGTLNRSEDAIGVYDELIERYGSASEPALRAQVAKAMFNKGIRLGALNCGEEAIGMYDQLIKRYGAASEPALREQVAKAMVNKGFTLRTLNRSKDAIGVYDEVIERFGAASEPALCEQVTKAKTARSALQSKSRTRTA